MMDFGGLREGTQLRLARVAAGLTLFDVGSRAGVSPPRLSEFERGVRPMEPSAVDRVRSVLAAALDAGDQHRDPRAA